MPRGYIWIGLVLAGWAAAIGIAAALYATIQLIAQAIGG